MALRVALLLLGAGGVGSISSNVCFHGASAAESSASTLRPLQLIGGHVRTDRIPLMSLYRPFFAGQAIYLTGADPVMPNSFRNLSKLANHGVSDYVDCTRRTSSHPQLTPPCAYAANARCAYPMPCALSALAPGRSRANPPPGGQNAHFPPSPAPPPPLKLLKNCFRRCAPDTD